MIPKILFQTSGTADLHEVLAQTVKQLRGMNPGWEYRFFDDADILAFIARHYPGRVLKAYNRLNPAYGACRADLFRYLAIYYHGGVYLDIKSSTSRPLDEVLLPDDSYVLAHWPNRKGESYPGWGHHPGLEMIQRGELQQWHVIAQPRHPYLEGVIRQVLYNIETYDTARHGSGFYGAMGTTGPIAYSVAIARRMHAGTHRLCETHEKLGLIYSAVDEPRGTRHHDLFAKTHYSRLQEPVVLPA